MNRIMTAHVAGFSSLIVSLLSLPAASQELGDGAPSTTSEVVEEQPTRPPVITYALDGSALSVKVDGVESSRLDLSCDDPREVIEDDGQRLFIACEGALEIVDVSQELPRSTREVIETPARPRSITMIDGETWVWVERSKVRLEELDALALDAARGDHSEFEPFDEDVLPLTSNEPGDRGAVARRVLRVDEARIVTELGSDDGAWLGRELDFFVLERDDDGMTRERVILRAPIVKLDEATSEVRAALDPSSLDRVRVRIAEDSPGRASQITRRVSSTELRFHARPIVAVGSLGIGLLADAHAIHHFEAPLSVAFRLNPLGAVYTNRGSSAAFAAMVSGSYDTDYVGLGLGAGYIVTPSISSFNIAQELRIGQRDRHMFHTQMLFHLEDESFTFEGIRAEARVLVPSQRRELWLFARGGGGVHLSHGFGEGGLRMLLRGDGQKKSTFIDVSLGGAVFITEQDFFGGPTIGVGFEHRP